MPSLCFQNNNYKRHCSRSMPKMSNKIKFKRKSFGEYFVIRKKLFYVKRNVMFRETFSILYLYFWVSRKLLPEKCPPPPPENCSPENCPLRKYPPPYEYFSLRKLPPVKKNISLFPSFTATVKYGVSLLFILLSFNRYYAISNCWTFKGRPCQIK